MLWYFSLHISSRFRAFQAQRVLLWAQSLFLKLLVLFLGFLIISVSPIIDNEGPWQVWLGWGWNRGSGGSGQWGAPDPSAFISHGTLRLGGVSQSSCGDYCAYNSDGGVPALNTTLSTIYQVGAISVSADRLCDQLP
jgi:hypothetical protein